MEVSAIFFKRSQENQDYQTIVTEIRNLQRQMIYTERWFQNEDDTDLIEACIYQKELLNAKYRYLLRAAKSCGSKDVPTV